MFARRLMESGCQAGPRAENIERNKQQAWVVVSDMSMFNPFLG